MLSPAPTFPDFQPHRLFRHAHAQTIVGAFAPAKLPPYTARREIVTLADSDQIVLHDDCPARWQRGDRVAILIHGLGGSHESGYMRRIAGKLTAAGVRAFRMDMRGCGAGARLARWPFHGGRSSDLAAASTAVERICPGSPQTVIGFSLGGNVVLKLLGEWGAHSPAVVDRAMAFNPPMDLHASVQNILQPANRIYQQFFLRGLLRMAHTRAAWLQEPVATHRCRTILAFDETYTAPICGFQSAVDYYRRSSASPLIESIRVPTLIVSAADDPLVPASLFSSLGASPPVAARIVAGGGHLGYISRSRVDPDRRWMDWRVVAWVTADDPWRMLAQVR